MDHEAPGPTVIEVPGEDVAFADVLREAVVSRFAKGDPVKVQMRNHKGKAIYDFMGIPRAKLQALRDALAALSIEVVEEQRRRRTCRPRRES